MGCALCLAGKAALPGVPLQAYLVGYRSPRCVYWDFQQPFVLGLGWLSPFMRARHDSRAGKSSWTSHCGRGFTRHATAAAATARGPAEPARIAHSHQPNGTPSRLILGARSRRILRALA